MVLKTEMSLAGGARMITAVGAGDGFVFSWLPLLSLLQFLLIFCTP